MSSSRTITDTAIHWPSWAELSRVVTLQDYNTRVVVIGVTCLGLASGIIGSFMLLRKRALLSDALSHATLPGIGLAFIIMSSMGATGRSLSGILLGATVSGVLGVLCILLIVHQTRIKEDAALGIVLSVFFGLGTALLGVIQSMATGSAAGLKSFIYGKTASMLGSDALLIAATATLVTVVCIVLFKEMALLCFDQTFAQAIGRPVIWLDAVMMALVVIVTVIGLQAVGLILMVALLIIPPAAARFWTNHLPTMVVTAALIGAVSGLVGAGLSALVPRLPAGAVIVLIAGVFFGLSMILGPARGALTRFTAYYQLSRKVARQHLLRALYELSEPDHPAHVENPAGAGNIAFSSLLAERSWSARHLRRSLRGLFREGLVVSKPNGDSFALTKAGETAAWRVVRNHRLWELFLITHADIAPSHVDRDADEVEHVLEPDLIQELETELVDRYPDLAAPLSPHRFEPGLSGTVYHRGAGP